ncbi:hypothetical protein JVT61DRAFT_7446 [Boletus reticuloceps]|uniref:Uncharacterized protein n=1 Tax=Boletus reticuloceps TaxID=495285 RepID=A0A8I3A5Q1_9AGAM|nr:hypothetical protein JVT61DRAFT_7446 [Boletus reticuloceps]
MSNHSKILCNPATNNMIIIWIIGHVVSTWFQNNGWVEKQALITVMPLSDELRTQTACLLAGLSVPHEGTHFRKCMHVN